MQQAGGQTSARPQSRCAGLVLCFPRLTRLIFQTTITSPVGFCFNKHPSNNRVSQALVSNSTSHSKLENLYMNILKIHAAPEQSQNNHRIESPLTLQDDANR